VVAGYVISHDVSERTFQLDLSPQWDLGKSCETFNPLGPWLVTADEVPDPQSLRLRLAVNGRKRQDGTSGNMIFSVPAGGELTGLSADVTADASVRLAIGRAAESLGGIDILVNNAGVGATGTVAGNPDAQWHRVFEVNVVGIVRVSPAASAVTGTALAVDGGMAGLRVRARS
jgi:hypothetical protein